MGETFLWLSLGSPHLGSGIVYVLIYVYVQIVGCFFLLLLLFSFFSAVDEGEVGWEFFRMFNKFIHVGIFLMYSIIAALWWWFFVCVGVGGEGLTTFVVIRGVVLRKHLVWSSDSCGLHSHIWHCL